jgi:B12-binding domain/radical SAM domain protein of rhizo-twelve system
VRVALINPPWTFDGSIYFGCREPHLPLELAYARDLLRRAGHAVELFDAHLLGQSAAELARAVVAFRPEMTVITTAPTYLFWRCAPPELRVPLQVLDDLRRVGLVGITVAVGPHGSATPRTALRKLGVDIVVMGECEETLLRLAQGEGRGLTGIAYLDDGRLPRVNGGPQAARFIDAPPLVWPQAWLDRHRHHHHRFDREPDSPGAEVEASRGCPYHCSFCAKENFRDGYRRRLLPLLLAEIDGLTAAGVDYVYFIDEIFLPNRPLLEALAERNLRFGIQTRIDLWKPDMLELLGRAGCVSIEAGVESLTVEGRDILDKNCRMDTDALTGRLIEAKRHVPFVQGNLIGLPGDDAEQVRAWRDRLRDAGVWANEPVPLFPYPGSPDYRKLWGEADDKAWERAHDHYVGTHVTFSDLQDDRPLPLAELEQLGIIDNGRALP